MELDVLGLSGETQRVYTALVGLPRSPAGRVADACGVSASVAGRVLAGLVREGLAARAAGRPPLFTATAPDVAVTALIQEREHRLDTARSLVQRLTEIHREALRISDPDIAVELLTDREDISAAVRRLTDGAQREVRAFDRPPYVDRPGSNLQTQVERQRTGVVHRVVYDRAAVAWPGRLEDDILPSVRTGEQARVRAELPLKLVLSDDRSAIIPFSLAPRGHSAAYLIHRSPMLSALEALFEAEWERAVPLRDAVEGVETPVPDDPESRSLLLLLTSGSTDAAIARALGWSQRTTQRRIHRLMAELGASTRFQAAALAARRGWL
ncbi:helix-turn-helix domain-containing protein [Actinacidiphila rubida]|uniref:Sugar-specific transcriptional regulator TrmB n=1 Tax=Actinacidiphila rubida TaxID=310780 RepID=A0A1H8UYJ0_9ACTN|nr:helix-turn-helix domain-containing protein [Actinacidiphila rubida]SEP08047.1 Sugar-specific transcriptional regulator TrmB [Actinacidiphila rubida]